MAGPYEKFAAQLSGDERMLVSLRDELYEGSWEEFLKDLKERLEGKPYIFKLVNRISADIQRIEKLREYEKKHRINLKDYLEKREER